MKRQVQYLAFTYIPAISLLQKPGNLKGALIIPRTLFCNYPRYFDIHFQDFPAHLPAHKITYMGDKPAYIKIILTKLPAIMKLADI